MTVTEKKKDDLFISALLDIKIDKLPKCSNTSLYSALQLFCPVTSAYLKATLHTVNLPLVLLKIHRTFIVVEGRPGETLQSFTEEIRSREAALGIPPVRGITIDEQRSLSTTGYIYLSFIVSLLCYSEDWLKT